MFAVSLFKVRFRVNERKKKKKPPSGKSCNYWQRHNASSLRCSCEFASCCAHVIQLAVKTPLGSIACILSQRRSPALCMRGTCYFPPDSIRVPGTHYLRRYGFGCGYESHLVKPAVKTSLWKSHMRIFPHVFHRERQEAVGRLRTCDGRSWVVWKRLRRS